MDQAMMFVSRYVAHQKRTFEASPAPQKRLVKTRVLFSVASCDLVDCPVCQPERTIHEITRTDTNKNIIIRGLTASSESVSSVI